MRRLACLLATALSTMGLPLHASPHWPQFRGPEGDGIARGSSPPIHWDEERNIRWQTPIHGKGWASPVVWGDRIWLATATEDGTELSILCVDADSGAIRRDLKLFEVADPQFCHRFNSYASPTPVLEEGRVYVTFGSPGTACLDADTGRVRWERRDFVCNHFRGAGSSPIVYGDLLLMNFDGSDAQFVVALDKHTGETVWRTERSIDFRDLLPNGEPEAEGDFRKAYGTPHVARIGGLPTLISQGAKAIYAYLPDTGRELWRVEERDNHSAGTRPVVGDGRIYVTTGYSTGQVLSLVPGKPGEVIDANADAPSESQLGVAWSTRRGAPKKPSLLLHRGLLFGIEDGGVATCWDASTGEVLWNERVGGNHSASPILADGRIYFANEEGKTTVVAADRTFRKLADNELGDGFMASPAVIGDALILRSRTMLYRVEEKATGNR